jgi:hypothetical protein
MNPKKPYNLKKAKIALYLQTNEDLKYMDDYALGEDSFDINSLS